MRLGFHLSIGGGLLKAVEQGLRTGCECAQIFSRNPRSWQSKPLAHADAREFDQARRRAGLEPLAVHLPYLPNLASLDEELYLKSWQSLAEEMSRADLLGADYVVAHPGHAARDQNRGPALDRVAQAIELALEKSPGTVTLLLETTSGQRGELGENFGELAYLIGRVNQVPNRPPLGLCFDTAHIWAAGYDLSTSAGLEKTLAELDRTAGLSALHLIHLNDSLVECGARRDRHSAVGLGRIGARNLARLVRHPQLAHLAGVMETPRTSDADDLANMRRAKKWRRSGIG
jgi:deoxyribonuclease-4